MMRRPRSLQVLRGCGRATSFVFLIAAACLSGGCVLNGDFGRIRPELTAENMHDWVGRDAAVATGSAPSEFRTTDQERDLRDRAYALIEPPYNRGRWDSVMREYGPQERSREAAAVRPHRISLQAAQGLSPFRGVGLCADHHRRPQRRRRGCSRSSPSPPASPTWTGGARRAWCTCRTSTRARRGNAIARNRENAAIIAWVCVALKERVASYRYALERLVVAVPNADAAEADRAIALLVTRRDEYCGILGGTIAVRG